MDNNFRISLFDIVISFSNALDLVSQLITDHHKQVAYIAYCISEEMKLPRSEITNIVFAGLLHDAGALSLNTRIKALEFEASDIIQHADVGYELLRIFNPFETVSYIVKEHHTSWDYNSDKRWGKFDRPIGANILFLADRVAIQMRKEASILNQSKNIVNRVVNKKGSVFSPDVVDAFLKVANKESFWFDSISPSLILYFPEYIKTERIDLGIEELNNLALMFATIIDFRSPYTATHSRGVANAAHLLAKYTGMGEHDVKKMKVAGYLHDIGKLAVPNEILDKKGPLDVSEFNIIKSHTYYTYRTLESIPEFDDIKKWAAYHHETLDGEGYPFHISTDNLCTGSRIMAVADIFTAITEDRPYRDGMQIEEALNIINNLAKRNKIDKDISGLLIDNISEINASRVEIRQEAIDKFMEIEKVEAA